MSARGSVAPRSSRAAPDASAARTGGARGRDEPRRGRSSAATGRRRRSPRSCSRRSTCSRSASGFGIARARTSGTSSTSQYVATGVVATAVLFSSAFPGMFNTFVRWQFQRTYDAMLAAPVDVEELITAEVLWISVRAGVYGVAPLLVAIAFGLRTECRGCCSCRSSASSPASASRLRRADRRGREDDRQLQLRHERGADADVPRRRHLLPDLDAAGGRGVRRRSSTRSTTACSSSATPRSAALGTADLGHAGGAARVRAADVAARDLAARQAADRLSAYAATLRFLTRCSYRRRRCSRDELLVGDRFGRSARRLPAPVAQRAAARLPLAACRERGASARGAARCRGPSCSG